MPKPKINDTKLLYLIDEEKLNQSQAARRLGVSRQAIHKRLQKIKGKTTKVLVVKKVEKVVDQKIDAIDQLQKINSDAREILDLCMKWQRGDPVAIRIMESQIRQINVGTREDPIMIEKARLKDPREIALRAMSEIRQQLEFQLKLFQALYSVQEVEEFMKTVLEVMREVDPDVRREIVRRLNDKKSVRSAVRFS